MKKREVHIALSLILLFTIFMLNCRPGRYCFDDESSKHSSKESIHFDLQDIKKRGKLIALTDNSSTSFYIYRGEPMGFEYELLKAFSHEIGVELVIYVVKDLDDIFNQLNQGKGDIVAANMTVTKERSKIVSFSEPLMMTKQVLIQKKSNEASSKMIQNTTELIGKEIHVRKKSSFYTRLNSLSNEIGGEINIIEVAGDYDTETLIKKVALGDIEYTIADENVAMINQTYYNNIDISVAISFPQKIAWAVRNSSPNLLEVINIWLKGHTKTAEFAFLQKKYFKSAKSQRDRVNDHYSSLNGKQLSPYDAIIQVRAKLLKWDWKLLASQIFQESNFNPNAESWAGARGLMQVMPQTAAQYGQFNLYSPYENLKVGTLYLAWLDRIWQDKIMDDEERIKFVLASYNAGLGHVYDARNLAVKLGKNPMLWDGHVAECMLLKSKNEYYQDEVVKHGYCRGEEPYNYVKEILNRYEYYKLVII
jgi:membrane-bound lytic murein transglycosylase F